MAKQKDRYFNRASLIVVGSVVRVEPRYTRSMIRLGTSVRFSPREIDEFRQVGLSAVCGETEIDHGPDSVPQFRGTPRQ